MSGSACSPNSALPSPFAAKRALVFYFLPAAAPPPSPHFPVRPYPPFTLSHLPDHDSNMHDHPLEDIRRTAQGVQRCLARVGEDLQHNWNRAVQPFAEQIVLAGQRAARGRRNMAGMPPFAVRISTSGSTPLTPSAKLQLLSLMVSVAHGTVE